MIPPLHTDLGPWALRVEEMAGTRSPLDWPRAWALLARSETRRDFAWGHRVLWTFRYWSWVRALGADPRTCRVCAARIVGRLDAEGVEHVDPRSRYCTPACRKRALRHRQSGEPTPLDELLAVAAVRLAEIDRELADAQRWVERAKERRLRVPPPDLSRYENLPVVPGRCGRCDTGAGCDHTGGGACLHALRPDTAPPPPSSGAP
jgi:hypothetical protein